MNTGQIDNLLAAVASRRQLLSLAQWFYRYTLALAGVYVVVLLLSRLLALIPGSYFPLWSILVVPAGALILALATHRKPSPAAAARLVDLHAKTKDLFLTAVDLQRRPDTVGGEYQDVVLNDAVNRASSVRAEAVVPIAASPRILNLLIALALLGLLTMIPQLDPLGRHEQVKRLAERKDRLEQIEKITALREQTLTQRDLTKAQSPQVEQALDELKQTFNQMKPTDPKSNLAKLQEEQRQVGEAWRKANEERLKEGLNRSTLDQHFGSGDPKKSQEWKDELENGKADALQKEMDQISQKADELAKTTDPIKQQELQHELEQKMENLADFANKQPGGKALADALNRAKQQMEMGKMPGMGKDAMQAMKDSMQLSAKEAQAMAQAMRDAKTLDKALETLQQAKALNQIKPLDGSECKNCQNMGDYAKFFSQMMSQCQGQGQGQGQMPGMPSLTPAGMGPNGGLGRGGVAPENPNLKMASKDEQDPSALSAGKILAKWSERDIADKGHANVDFQQLIDNVKQGASEAITAEQVPPDRVDVIKKYFDHIEQSVDKPATPSDKPAKP